MTIQTRTKRKPSAAQLKQQATVKATINDLLKVKTQGLGPEKIAAACKAEGTKGIPTAVIEAVWKATVKAYMRSQLGDFLDSCGEVEMTGLAEEACDWFEAYGPPPKYEIPEDFFEWSFEISEWFDALPQKEQEAFYGPIR